MSKVQDVEGRVFFFFLFRLSLFGQLFHSFGLLPSPTPLSLFCLLSTCVAPLSCSSSSPSYWRPDLLHRPRCSVGSLLFEQGSERGRGKGAKCKTNADAKLLRLEQTTKCIASPLPPPILSLSLSLSLSFSILTHWQQGATRSWTAPPMTPPSTKLQNSPSSR